MKAIAVFLASGLLAVTTSFLPAAVAETIALKTDLKGSNSVPPNASTATGTVAATYDTVTKVLNYTVTFSGLSGPAIAAHFHGPAEAGKNAGIAVHFPAVASPIKGTATLTDAQAADLLAGRWYANIHTNAIPSGEIRGQLVK
jgi:hypothetical protein